MGWNEERWGEIRWWWVAGCDKEEKEGNDVSVALRVNMQVRNYVCK